MNSLVLLAAGASLTDVKTGLIIWTWITFAIVLFLLKRFAWKPLLSAVNQREKSIVDAIESAKRERAEAEKLLAEQKSSIAQARQEAADQVAKTRAEMDRFRDELMARARTESELLKAEAKRSIEDERNKAMAELRAETARLAIQVAEKLISERLDDAKHQQLAAQFVADLAKHQRPTA